MSQSLESLVLGKYFQDVASLRLEVIQVAVVGVRGGGFISFVVAVNIAASVSVKGTNFLLQTHRVSHHAVWT